MKPKIQKLGLEDTRHLQAAEGWLELGDVVSASDELEEITAQARANPTVLQMRYAIYAKAGRWNMATEVAGALAAETKGMQPRSDDIRVARREPAVDLVVVLGRQADLLQVIAALTAAGSLAGSLHGRQQK